MLMAILKGELADKQSVLIAKLRHYNEYKKHINYENIVPLI